MPLATQLRLRHGPPPRSHSRSTGLLQRRRSDCRTAYTASETSLTEIPFIHAHLRDGDSSPFPSRATPPPPPLPREAHAPSAHLLHRVCALEPARDEASAVHTRPCFPPAIGSCRCSSTPQIPQTAIPLSPRKPQPNPMGVCATRGLDMPASSPETAPHSTAASI